MTISNSLNLTTASLSYLETLRENFRRAPKVDINCPLCDGSKMSTIARTDRHDLGLRIMMCRRCAMAMVRPRPNDDWFNQFYRDQFWPLYIGSRFADLNDMYVRDQCSERSHQIWDAIAPFLNFFPKNYLDIGCGQGAMLAEFRTRYPNTCCNGVEPSVDAAEYCFNRHGFRVNTVACDSLRAGELPGPFDLITLIHVLEHVLNPVDVLARAVQRLSDGGLMYVEVPDLLSDRWSGKDFFHIAHISYFSEVALRNLFLRCGLEVLGVVRGAAEVWPWAIGFVGRKGSTHPYRSKELPAVPRDFIERVKHHLDSREIITAPSFSRLPKNLPWFVCPRKVARFLLKHLRQPSEV
jgi:SAM-dependent methyltransferase